MPGRVMDRLRGLRHFEWLLLILALAAAVLLAGSGEEETIAAAGTALERRMESVLSCVEGAGRVRVLVHEGGSTSGYGGMGASDAGVLVVAEGADDLRVRLGLQQAVQALLNVEAAQIEILPMKENES